MVAFSTTVVRGGRCAAGACVARRAGIGTVPSRTACEAGNPAIGAALHAAKPVGATDGRLSWPFVLASRTLSALSCPDPLLAREEAAGRPRRRAGRRGAGAAASGYGPLGARSSKPRPPDALADDRTSRLREGPPAARERA